MTRRIPVSRVVLNFTGTFIGKTKCSGASFVSPGTIELTREHLNLLVELVILASSCQIAASMPFPDTATTTPISQ